MAVYQERAKERIKKGLRRMTNIVEKGRTEDEKGRKEADCKEEDLWRGSIGSYKLK